MGRLVPGISTWAALILCADCIVRSTGDQCSTICDLIKAEASSSEACAKSRKSLPRPKIGRVCQEGFDEAFKLTCSELCSFYGTSRLVPSYLGGACDKRKREVPRPAVHKACVDGFNAGLAATTTLITKRIESMDDDARNSFIDNNADLLKEADAERDTPEEVEKARDAQQVKKREEAQERARKALEEKSAEVKREKDALSKKQELETARAADEAEQGRKQAEQERQERTKAADPKETKEDTSIDSSAGTTADSETAAAHSRPQRIVPGETRKDAPISDVQDSSGAGVGGAHYQEIAWAVQAMRVEAVVADTGVAEKAWVPVEERGVESRDGAEATLTGEMPEEALAPEKRTQGSQSAPDAHEVNALPAVVEKEVYAGLKDERTIEVRSDPTYRDVTEGVKDLELTLAQQGAPSKALDGQLGLEADLERDPTSEDSDGVKLPNNDRHEQQEAATAAVLAKRGALDGGLKNAGGAFQKSREYPEALSTENVQDFELSLVPQNDQPRERTGGGEAAAETDLDAGSENSAVANLPNDRLFLEAFKAEHVHGSGTPLVREDGPANNFDHPGDQAAIANGIKSGSEDTLESIYHEGLIA